MVLQSHFEFEWLLPGGRRGDVKRWLDVEYLNCRRNVFLRLVVDRERDTFDREVGFDRKLFSKQSTVVKMFRCRNTQRRVLWHSDFHFSRSLSSGQDLFCRTEFCFLTEPAKSHLLDLDLGHASIANDSCQFCFFTRHEYRAFRTERHRCAADSRERFIQPRRHQLESLRISFDNFFRSSEDATSLRTQQRHEHFKT